MRANTDSAVVCISLCLGIVSYTLGRPTTTPYTGVPASLLLLLYKTRPRQRQDLNIVFFISLEPSPGANLGRASLDTRFNTTCSFKPNCFIEFVVLSNNYR